MMWTDPEIIQPVKNGLKNFMLKTIFIRNYNVALKFIDVMYIEEYKGSVLFPLFFNMFLKLKLGFPITTEDIACIIKCRPMWKKK